MRGCVWGGGQGRGAKQGEGRSRGKGGAGEGGGRKKGTVRRACCGRPCCLMRSGAWESAERPGEGGRGRMVALTAHHADV